jgi:hypothetical protein
MGRGRELPVLTLTGEDRETLHGWLDEGRPLRRSRFGPGLWCGPWRAIRSRRSPPN